MCTAVTLSLTHLAHHALPSVKRFGLLIRKLWNPRAFKGQVSPHELLQEVTNASQRRFKILQQGDAHEFLAWFLNTLHRDLGGRQTGTSVVFKAFQGEIIMRSRPVDGGDDRSEDGYDDDEEQDGARSRKRNHHTTKTLPFLFLSFDLPPIPLFTDEQDRNIIPQVPLGVLLSKFDGHTEHVSCACVCEW